MKIYSILLNRKRMNEQLKKPSYLPTYDSPKYNCRLKIPSHLRPESTPTAGIVETIGRDVVHFQPTGDLVNFEWVALNFMIIAAVTTNKRR